MAKFFLMFLLEITVCSLGLQSKAQEYPIAILPGDYPDPTILRDGQDYYMTHSPFYYRPGFLIWHSQDLQHWKPICRAAAHITGTAMAPDLVKVNGRFYIYYPAEKSNWVIWADNILGPWSSPVNLKVSGIDPAHIVGEDGKRYLFLSEGQVIPLSDDGLSVIGESQTVYNGWNYPKQWITECMCLESPKLTIHNGYFYLTSAQGGTAGPATSHMVVSARSKSIKGPWENSPYNPIVHTYSNRENWWSKGHGTLVDDEKGNWWIVYHAYANGYHTLGRQTLIEPVEWTADGWFRIKKTSSIPQTDTLTSNGLALNDDFIGPSLGIQWTYWKEYTPEALTFKNRALYIKGKGQTPADGRLLLTTATDKNYEVQTTIQIEKNSQGGMVLFYNEKAYTGLLSNGKTFTIWHQGEKWAEIPNTIGKQFDVRIQNKGNQVYIAVCKKGSDWQTLAERLDVSTINHNRYKGFYALRIGLVSTGKGKTSFSQFRYRNAVPKENEMSAYLMVFHKDEDHGLHMAMSSDGYTFTALNDGKAIISGDTIAEQKGIRDPHIMRGPDGAFYMAMTDLHVFAQRDGLRDTQWERDGATYGWGNNRGLVLMKSWDLIHWKHTNLRFDKLTAGLGEVGCVWAPEVIYDEKKGKLMIYFTMRFKNEPNKLYYAYVNEDFNQLESFPQLLFEYPNERVSAIDGDITKVGNQYHLFYVAHDGKGGIKHAVSSSIHNDWQYDARWYDFESKACEAPNVWKRIGENKWVLMYDVYTINPHNFAFAETSDFVNFENLGHFNEKQMHTTNFTSPKHGAVIHLTQEEAQRLARHWNLKMEFQTSDNIQKRALQKATKEVYDPALKKKENPILNGLYADPEVLYSEQTGRYYLYPTSDGYANWSGSSFKAFSSDDLVHWTDEGVILDLKTDVTWADSQAWAPCIIEKKGIDGHYKYYFYYTANKKIGVAIADSPTGPFTDSGKPLIDSRPQGINRGQNIDPDVFTDPQTGKSYLYWGNYFWAVCELNNDMVSVKPNTTQVLIPNDSYYSEAGYVFFRNGFYYFCWSKNDTRSPDYEVRYVKGISPTCPINAAESQVILSKNPQKGIYGTGHQSILQLPGKDQWYMVYHRFKRPEGISMGRNAGFHREICMDPLLFKGDEIIPIEPTL